MRVAFSIAITLMLFVGCSTKGRSTGGGDIVLGEFIPDSNAPKAADWTVRLLAAPNLARNGNDDADDCIKEARNSALKIFGVTTWGIEVVGQGRYQFIPYEKCGPEQKRAIDLYLKP